MMLARPCLRWEGCYDVKLSLDQSAAPDMSRRLRMGTLWTISRHPLPLGIRSVPAWCQAWRTVSKTNADRGIWLSCGTWLSNIPRGWLVTVGSLPSKHKILFLFWRRFLSLFAHHGTSCFHCTFSFLLKYRTIPAYPSASLITLSCI